MSSSEAVDCAVRSTQAAINDELWDLMPRLPDLPVHLPRPAPHRADRGSSGRRSDHPESYPMRKGQPVKGISLTGLVRRRWMILVAVAVVALAGFAVYRLHDAFGSQKNAALGSGVSNEIVPFNPKQVIYEVFGSQGPQRRSTTRTSMPRRNESTTPRCRGPTRSQPPIPRSSPTWLLKATATHWAAASPSTASSKTKGRSTN